MRRIALSASAERLPVGHLLILRWKVACQGTAVASVQLACQVGADGSIQMMESIPAQGLRQMIFNRPDHVTFTLTAIFRDGSKRRKQIRVCVEE